MGTIDSSQSKKRETVEHLDGSVTEYSYFEPSADAMDSLVKVLFEKHWRNVVVGPCIEGSVFEVRFSEAPKLTMLDGYLTVNLGPWHFHLCIAEHKGNRSPELATLVEGPATSAVNLRLVAGGFRGLGITCCLYCRYI